MLLFYAMLSLDQIRTQIITSELVVTSSALSLYYNSLTFLRECLYGGGPAL